MRKKNLGTLPNTLHPFIYSVFSPILPILFPISSIPHVHQNHHYLSHVANSSRTRQRIELFSSRRGQNKPHGKSPHNKNRALYPLVFISIIKLCHGVVNARRQLILVKNVKYDDNYL